MAACGSDSSMLHPLFSPAFLFARSIERFEADRFDYYLMSY